MNNAVILGATSGMGYDLAISLLEKGCRLGLAGRNEKVLQDIQKKYGPEKVVIQRIDVTDEDSPQLLEDLINRLGGMECYMHFSGIGSQNPDLDPQIEDHVLQTNAIGFTRMVDFAYNWFKNSGQFNQRHKGHIVVVTSVAATKGMGVASAYSSTKKYQSTYITGLSQLSHIHGDPVFFTEIRPGFVTTPMLKRHYPCEISREKANKYILQGILKKKRVVIFDWRYRVAIFFWKLIPRWLWERTTVFR